MIGRRDLLVGAASSAALAVWRAQAEQPILTDDGLYKQPWFLESFLDLSDDLEEAAKEGKLITDPEDVEQEKEEVKKELGQ